ncbi:Uncharacterised protein [Mycobacteroides abscessus subsp. abscessus]|nr:Uncharacterised protein [Mycobacteroides abscessus subsp. abscessus]
MARKVSKASAALSLDRMYFCSATVGLSCLASMRSCSHFCCSGSRMWVYSTPAWRQYASRSTESTSRSFMYSWPWNPETLNSRSRSHRVRPWLSTSRSGWLRKRVLSRRSGSVSAMRWPRLRYAAMSSSTRAFLSTIESGLSMRQRTGS